MKYQPLSVLSDVEISEVLSCGSIDDIATLPFSVGMNHPNWKIAQDICVALTFHESPRVRANAILGLSYIARTKGKLEKHIVKPIILRELRENMEFKWRIIDAIEDINLFMKWRLADSVVQKQK